MVRRLLIIGGVFVFVGIIVWSIVYINTPRASLLMSVAPDEVSVTINSGTSRTVQTGDTISVSPGEITVVISRDGFDTYTEMLTIGDGEEREILTALNPQTAAARALLQTEKSQAIIQRIANKELEKKSSTLTETYPIVSVLPIKDKFYTVSMCQSHEYPNDPSKLAVCVYLYNLEAKDSAIADITRRGFNLNDYETEFINAEYDPSGTPLHPPH